MFKLAINAGHYYYTSGKRCLKKLDSNETREWTLNDRIVDKIEKMLSEYDGVEILRLDDTTGQKGISIEDRVAKANAWGADFYLPIHHNAGIQGGSGGGIVAYIYSGKVTAETVEWQKDLYNTLIKKTGLKGNRSTPLAKANLYECRAPKCPSVLLELGFMDSKTDVPIILTDDFATKAAEACVEVIVKRGNLSKKAEPAQPTVKMYYRVAKAYKDGKYEGQVGAYTVLANAITKATEVKLPVFDWTGTKVWEYKEPVKINKKVQTWQKAAIADGFKFASGADGIWGKECEEVAKKAICSKPLKGKPYTNKNLTKFIQTELGFSGKNIDGLYGANTEKKVKAFQKNKKLTQDGVCGLNTWKKFLGV